MPIQRLQQFLVTLHAFVDHDLTRLGFEIEADLIECDEVNLVSEDGAYFGPSGLLSSFALGQGEARLANF